MPIDPMDISKMVAPAEVNAELLREQEIAGSKGVRECFYCEGKGVVEISAKDDCSNGRGSISRRCVQIYCYVLMSLSLCISLVQRCVGIWMIGQALRVSLQSQPLSCSIVYTFAVP